MDSKSFFKASEKKWLLLENKITTLMSNLLIAYMWSVTLELNW